MGIKRIYMDRSTLARNKKTGVFDAAICVRISNRVLRGHDVYIEGHSQVKQLEVPNLLAGGATVWIETNSPVRIIRHKEEGNEEYTQLI